MSGSPNLELEDLFAALLECPPAERDRFIDQACHGDPALRQEVLELLSTHFAAGPFFAGLSNDIAAAAPLELESAVQPQVEIGPYRTLEVIGHGGMGAVYLAVRVDGEFDQQVALKLIHLDMDTPEIRARFLVERQILARLTHPNIARLQDGGVTDEGRPYFVMEYVEGLPITQFCDEGGLSLEQRLDLFFAVIAAVSYLHRNLVVHRDLKPSNILVGADGQVKLVDFGIAKLLAEASVGADRTRTSKQLMSPQYAAPEQITNGPVTTATDVYALGVVLYELLAGCRPHDRNTMDLSAIQNEMPPLPSALLKLSRDSAKEQPLLAWRRIAGDLDNICLTALRPEVERRYPSAERLGQDLKRHLDGVPVLARRNTLKYRLTKFAQRHRRGVIATAGLVALIAVGFVREHGLRGEAEQARAAAYKEAAKAVAVSDFLAELLSSVDPAKAQGREVTVAEILDQAAKRLEKGEALRDQVTVEAAVRLTIGNTYRALGKFPQAKTHLERARELLSRGVSAADPEALKALESLGVWYYAQGLNREAEPLLFRLLTLRVQSLGEDHPDTLTAMNLLANVFWQQGRLDEVESMDRKTLEIRQRVLGEDHPDTLRSLNGLAVTLFSTARYSEAAEMFQQALAAQQRLLGPNHPDTLQLGNNLASAYIELGRYRKGERLLSAVLPARVLVLGEEHEDTAQSMHNLGLTLVKQARYEEAESYLVRAIAARRSFRGKSSALESRALESESTLAEVYRDGNRLTDSESLYLITLERQRTNSGPEHAGTLKTASGLAELRLRQGEIAKADALINQVLEAQSRVLGSEHPDVLQSMITLARVRNTQQQFAVAEELSEQAVHLGWGTLGGDHPLVLDAKFEQVQALRGQVRLEAAEELALGVYRVRATMLGDDHPATVSALKLVINIYVAMDVPHEAEPYRELLAGPADR